MPTNSLPSDPSMVQLRKQARELQRRVRSQDPAALAVLAGHGPGFPPDELPLNLAQLLVARQYGFSSWPTLVAHVTALREYSRRPEVDLPDGDPQAQFLAHAVLRYSADDGPTRWRTAADLLAADPSIASSDVYTAAAVANHAAVQRFLGDDASLVNTPGGPLSWAPLLYLCYSRYRPDVPEADVVATARALLGAGADPNVGYLWHGETTPFTALTGVFGSGEQGSGKQPHHPHAAALAKVLLDAGADPNDGQTLYNRMFEPDNDHLDILFDHGLGEGDGGPWHRRFPSSTDSPTAMVRGQLDWAVSHGMADRIRLLAGRGVDLGPEFPGRSGLLTPIGLAVRSGLPHIADLLVELGAPVGEPDPATQLIGALLTGDASAVRASSATLLASVRRKNPALILRAAVAGSEEGIDLLLANGFDVNALGRQDVPVEQQWETALHYAAGEGKLELARKLLASGANPSVVDRRFEATPLSWAEHFGRTELVELLAPLMQQASPTALQG